MKCKRCNSYPENGGQYGGLDHKGLCSHCAAVVALEEKRKKED